MGLIFVAAVVTTAPTRSWSSSALGLSLTGLLALSPLAAGLFLIRAAVSRAPLGKPLVAVGVIFGVIAPLLVLSFLGHMAKLENTEPLVRTLSAIALGGTGLAVGVWLAVRGVRAKRGGTAPEWGLE